MDKSKILGVILILLSVLIIAIYFISKNIQQNEKVEEKQSSEIQQIDSNTDTYEPNNNNLSTDDLRIEEQDEAGAASEEELIKNWNCNIVSMSDELKSEIDDFDAFMYAIKDFMFTNGYVDTDVFSLDSLTIKYKEKKKLFLMGIEGENYYFNVVQDLNTGNYYCEEY